jgi:hypothetical protein
MSPTARTLLHLRKSGYIADVVERFIAAASRASWRSKQPACPTSARAWQKPAASRN